MELNWSLKNVKGFYIVLSGILKVENDTGWEGFELTSGDYFG